MPELFHKIGYASKSSEKLSPIESYWLVIGLGCMTWSPLIGGILSNKYKTGVPSKSRATLKGFAHLKNQISHSSVEDGIPQQKLDELELIASRLGFTSAQLAIG